MPRRRLPHRSRTAATLAAGALLLAAAPPVALAAPAEAAAPTQAPATAPAFGWGANGSGQLGLAVSSSSSAPRPTTVPAGTTALALGSGFTVALADGVVWTWGRDDRGQLGDGGGHTGPTARRLDLPPVAAVAAADAHALAVTRDGRVFAWGANTAGGVGDGTTTDRATPVAVALPGGSHAAAVDAGGDASFAVTTTGDLLAWGSNRAGRLGDGTTVDRHRPVPVSLPGGAAVTAVAAGDRHTVALTRGGAVLAWGAGESGQLGRGDTSGSATPVLVALPAGTRVTALAAGSDTTLALTADGGVLGWGVNGRGELGDGTTTGRDRPVATLLPAGFHAGVLSLGRSQALARSRDGHTLLSWGRGAEGQLGVGALADAPRPAPVTTGPGSAPTWTVVAAGGDADLGVVTAGAPVALRIAPALPHVAVGTATTFTVTGVDAGGVPLGPFAGATLTLDGGHCADDTCTPDRPGALTLTARAGALSATGRVFAFVPASASGSPTTGPTGTPTGTPTTAGPTPGGTTAPPGGGSAGPEGGGGGLAATGVAVIGLALFAAAALAVGVTVTAAARRRRPVAAGAQDGTEPTTTTDPTGPTTRPGDLA